MMRGEATAGRCWAHDEAIGGHAFKKIRAWQEAVGLARDVYRITWRMPREHASLVDQIRRAARSVHANIAEGTSRRSSRELLHFLHIALGSLHELESDLVTIRPTAIFPFPDVAHLLTRTRRTTRLLTAFIARLTPPP